MVVVPMRSSHGEGDDGGAPVVFILAVVARTVPEMGVVRPIPASLSSGHQISRQVEVRQLTMFVEKHAWPLHRYKEVRCSIVILHSMLVWLNNRQLRQEVPRFPIWAEKMC